MEARNKIYIKNISNNPVSFGDLPKIPSILPNYWVNALDYYDYDKIQQSKSIIYCLKNDLIIINHIRDSTTTVMNVDTPEPYLKDVKFSDLDGSLKDSIHETFGAFYSTQVQSNSETVNTVTFNNTSLSNYVNISENSKILFSKSGTFLINFNAQVEKSDAGDDDIQIWVTKNNSNLVYSSSVFTVHANNGKAVLSWNFIISMSENEFIQLKWHSDDSNLFLKAQDPESNPSMPGVPSVRLSVHEIL